MQNLAHKVAHGSGRGRVRGSFRKLIRDDVRKHQRRRLRHLQKQDCDTEANEVFALVEAQVKEMPAALQHAIIVPSWRVFAAILALIRTAMTLQKGDGPIKVLELSAAEIAEKAGYSRSTVQAALRWLCGGPIHMWGVWVADGLGILERKKRFAVAMFGDHLAFASRTSTIEVSFSGKVLLRLLPTKKEKRTRQQQRRRRQTKGERAVEAYRTVIAKNPARSVSSNLDEPEEAMSAVDLRPVRNDAEGRAAVLRQLAQCLDIAFMKPKADAFIFPAREAFQDFQPREQAQFFKLVAKMEPDQQAIVPEHVRHMQV